MNAQEIQANVDKQDALQLTKLEWLTGMALQGIISARGAHGTPDKISMKIHGGMALDYATETLRQLEGVK